MKKQRVKAVALSTVISAGALFGGAAFADPKIDQILNVGQAKTTAAQKSQQRINKLQEETNDLLRKFKAVNKEIQGLQVYNAQLEKQLENQVRVISDLEESIANVTVIERQIQPLILRMLDGLSQFVELDMPLYPDERAKRLNQLRNSQDRADISVAEKFRQVLEAYSIEAEYGRTLHFYEDKMPENPDIVPAEVAGREVNIFGVGRVALMYQTKDGKLVGTWDKEAGRWESLDPGKYRSAILEGLKIAKKQASINVMSLPIPAPEDAQ